MLQHTELLVVHHSQCCANGIQMYTRLSTSDVELLLAVIECFSLDWR